VNAIARGVGAEAADPGDLQAEPRKADARIALGAGVVHEEMVGAPDRPAGWGSEGDHRFAQCDEVIRHFGFAVYFIANRALLALTAEFTV
jgi:hypothetical protein